jgi:hypothetical protein
MRNGGRRSRWIYPVFALGLVFWCLAGLRAMHDEHSAARRLLVIGSFLVGPASVGLVSSRLSIHRWRPSPILQAAAFGAIGLSIGVYALVSGTRSTNHVPVFFGLLLVPSSLFFLGVVVRAWRLSRTGEQRTDLPADHR